MSSVIEPAKTGRAACRGCRKRIAAGELRLGEGAPSSFGEGESMLWFHLPCAAYKRPEALLAALDAAPAPALPPDEQGAPARDRGLRRRPSPRPAHRRRRALSVRPRPLPRLPRAHREARAPHPPRLLRGRGLQPRRHHSRDLRPQLLRDRYRPPHRPHLPLQRDAERRRPRRAPGDPQLTLALNGTRVEEGPRAARAPAPGSRSCGRPARGR